ncbi:MAG: DUF2474 domain-containing protein [Rhodospirillales bacterium CG15_BIG_FIL_POST_REV_8_21_14_020_66_15]|nr:MAG: DUF2474 domain-containing protein [Rhodospirillales bacterium CG15_BIG_FIL_POST_REV_8_21_14_020_66_15]
MDLPRQGRSVGGLSLSGREPPPSARRRWLWFVGLWAAGVAAVAAAALLIRLVLVP